jgi:MSHA pilin protein MshD
MRGGAFRDRGGFTLIEIAVATVIIGIALAALLTAMAASTRTNSASQDITRAVFLAQEIREWTLSLPFTDQDEADQGNPPGPDGSDPQDYVDDLDDLMGVVYSPPRDGRGQPISDMAGWSQSIQLTWRSRDNLSAVVDPGSSDVVHVQVAVSHKGAPVLSRGWLITNGAK